MNNYLSQINELTKYKSFGEVIAQIVYHDFCGSFEELKSTNAFDKLNYNELLLITGLWVKNADKDYKLSCGEITKLRKKIHYLLNEFHRSMIKPISSNSENWLPDFKEMFFYSPTHAYDFQYCNLVSYKYDKDKDWIKNNTGLDIDYFNEYFLYIKSLFNKRLNNKKFIAELRKKGKIIDLFTFDKKKDNQLSNINGFYDFLDFFSIKFNGIPHNELNEFCDYNPCKEKPIIKLGPNKYFIPSSYQLAESIWESFFYKMIKSKYKDIACKHRGDFAEEVVYSYLTSTFDLVFKNMRLVNNKELITDIDVCVKVDNALILFMVKSKKLTLLSRQGDVSSVRKDYEQAIKESFEQGLIAKKHILSGNYDVIEDISFREEIKDVTEIFIYTVITDDYPLLAFQNLLFIKEFGDSPISISIFDLEVMLNYVYEQREFLRYTRLRHSFLKKMNMLTEMAFLEFFLTNSQSKIEHCDRILLANDWAQSIDADFYEKLIRGQNRQLNNYIVKQNVEN